VWRIAGNVANKQARYAAVIVVVLEEDEDSRCGSVALAALDRLGARHGGCVGGWRGYGIACK
jgi:hypothetical protein